MQKKKGFTYGGKKMRITSDFSSDVGKKKPSKYEENDMKYLKFEGKKKPTTLKFCMLCNLFFKSEIKKKW